MYFFPFVNIFTNDMIEAPIFLLVSIKKYIQIRNEFIKRISIIKQKLIVILFCQVFSVAPVISSFFVSLFLLIFFYFAFSLALPSHLPDLLLLLSLFEFSFLFVSILFLSLTELLLTSLSLSIILTALLLLPSL